MRRIQIMVALALTSLGPLAGCSWLWPDWSQKRIDPDLAKDDGDDVLDSSAYEGTVGEYAWFEGLRKMQVRGYGLVVGLGSNGTTECPREVRDKMLTDMYRMPEFRRSDIRTGSLSPEQLLDDPDTSPVIVQGEVPAGALPGTRFDVFISTIPGTQTTSLRNGRLFTCDLNVYRMVDEGAILSGSATARADGPIFVNPFSDRPSAATRTSERNGVIIGGGVVTEPRRVRLALYRASYAKARAIAARINNRFAGRDKVADAESPSYIRLRIPDEYRDDPKTFLAMVGHLYISPTEEVQQHRARQLGEEIVDPNAPHEEIGLAWQGIGRKALPEITKLYTHPDATVRFYAGLTGMRLGDDLAVEVLERCAANPTDTLRFEAIRELGRATHMYRAAAPLRRLLDEPDNTVRTAAYEGLLKHADRDILSKELLGGEFFLDLVPSKAGNLIYVKRSGERRIALFGDNLRCQPPVFFRHATGELTINGNEGEQKVTVVRQTRVARAKSPPVESDLDLANLISLLGGEPPLVPRDSIEGLGVDYGVVIQVLYNLAENRSINAEFMMEQTTLKELFGPSRPTGRPESELE